MGLCGFTPAEDIKSIIWEEKKTRAPIVEGGNGVSSVLVSSLAIFHVHCE